MDKENFVKLLEDTFKNNFDLPALTDYGTSTSFTYGEISREIAKLHILFDECKIRKGDKIALVGKNSSRWCIAYMASITYGATIVPILQDFSPNDIHHIINHSESVFLFTGDTTWDTLEEEKLPDLRGAFSLTNFGLKYRREEEEELETLIAQLDAKFLEKYPAFNRENINYALVPNDSILVLNYTSGTTGFSKGVMITGSNLSGNITYAHHEFKLNPGDKMLSFLPLAHTYGSAFEFLYAISEGCDVTILGKTPSPKILLKAFEDVKPILIISVPLILEKIYRKMILPTLDKLPMKLALSVPFLDAKIYAQIRKKLIDSFGGNFYQIIIGGAPLNAEVEEFLLKIKFPVSVGYGMTECAPLISFSLAPVYVPHSCGKLLPCMEVRIDSEDPYTVAGEIQVRGQNVMVGYYKNEEATKAAFTEDGWLKTGDLGTIDHDNNIFIRGRSKSMILSASGQNIYPEEIEAKLDNLPFVMESLVVDRNGKLIALVYPDYEAVDSLGMKEDDLKKIMDQNKNTLNGMVASYEKVAEIQLILFTASNVSSRFPKAVNRKNPSPDCPNPEPGVPTTCVLLSRRSKNSHEVRLLGVFAQIYGAFTPP
ncbi:long-chain-fatty-acid--CoA ligase [Clostridia bacterium]|nr:long-chain-fatty-acid--CoA ligase [Clostridia bacterium]